MKLNRHVFALAFIAISNNATLICHDDPFESVQKSMKIMETEMQSMCESMNKMHQEFFTSIKKELTQDPEVGVNIAIDEAENNEIQVIISGIQAEQFEATFNDKELTVKAPATHVVINTRHTTLTASISQEIKDETVNAKGEKQSSQQLYSSGSYSRMIAKPVNLEEAKIDYKKENKTLLITLPAKEQTKTSKTIPVNVN